MMYRLSYTIVIASGLLLSPGAQGQACLAPEANTVLLNDYNPLVCDGDRLQRQGDYAAAFAKIKKASKLPVGEWVNFELFPRLAVLSYRLGDHDAYRAYLMRAKIALEVYYGFIQCDWSYTHDATVAIEEFFKQGKVGFIKGDVRLRGRIVDEMFLHMCQGIMEFTYGAPTDLDEFLNDFVVRLYLEARSLGGKRQP